MSAARNAGEYEAVIGLEVHAQLATKSKIFSSSSSAFGAEPNSQTDPVCLGLPGALPVLNRRAVEFAIRLGLAAGCQINRFSIFARKHYFYPDSPKGYQISQFEQPVCTGGFVEIDVDGKPKRIGLTRIHLEEDAGKSVHAEVFVDEDETLIDLNRCGVPLVEIVSEPEIRGPAEAAAFLTELRRLVRYLGICDGNMEQGSLRCDANVSVRPVGTTGLGVKTELKNMNSISGVQNALEFEVERQARLLARGGSVVQETLLWNPDQGVAVPMRGKESSHDYRYFPEPDLLPLLVDDGWIQEVKAALPELPRARRRRLERDYALPGYDAAVLTATRELADYYEATARACGEPKLASNWIMGEVLRTLKERELSISEFPVVPERLAELLRFVAQGSLGANAAKSVFNEMVDSGKRAEAIIEEKDLAQISDAAHVREYVLSVLAAHPAEVAKYRAGKEQVFGFLVGQVMKASKGQANPKVVSELLRAELRVGRQ